MSMAPDDDSQPSHSNTLPDWLRQRYADTIEQARSELVRQAKRDMASGAGDAGILADRRIKAVLDAVAAQTPTDKTTQAYRRDHARLIENATTPLNKASTFQHWNRLRSAWRFCEAEIIRSLRNASETARKAGDYSRMRLLTVAAFERAVLLEAMFLADTSAPSRQTWGRKSAALRAAGLEKPPSKSKRAAGRTSLSPDQLLCRLAGQSNGTRVEVAAAMFACFGVRPAEALKGVRLSIKGDQLGLEVAGSKVDATRGQPCRHLLIRPAARGQSALAVSLLRGEVEAGRATVCISPAELAAVRRAMRKAQPGLSPYAYRHARSSDAKAQQGKAGAAAWLGHRTDRAQSSYGSARSSSGSVKITSAAGSRLVRRVKTLPGTKKAIRLPAASPAPISATPRPRLRPKMR